MRHILALFAALVMVMVSYSGTALDSASVDTEIGPGVAQVTLVEPGAPGPYTGPGLDAIPEGWNVWGGEDDIHNQCGELALVFLNTDLQEDTPPFEDDGMVHAQNRFFIQFQAVGERAEEITRFSFSFGVSQDAIQENPTLNCNQAIPDNPLGKGTAGAYLLFYRSDFDASDGFFVPIETRNVPDGTYAAAVHAYTGQAPNYVEVARAWALAVVKNCNGQSIPNSCPNDSPEDIIANDFTDPWPIVLPGDGEQTNDVNGLTIEVLEVVPADTVSASINGVEVPLSEWEPPARDRDLVPLNDEDGCPGGQNVRSVCEKVVYSTGFKWEGPVNIGDIIRVSLQDENGNQVTKQIHYGFTSGGAASFAAAEVDWETMSPDTATVKAGESHAYKMRLKNIGGADAHVNLALELNQTWMDGKWVDVENVEAHADSGETHVQIGIGEQTELDIQVNTSPDTPKGLYTLKAKLDYPAAGQTIVKERDLFLNIDNVFTQEELDAALNNTTDDEPKVEDSPAVGTVLVVSAIGLLAVAARRRRL